MAHIAVIGERARVEGWGLGGALAVPAGSPDEVRAAWKALDDRVAVVVLTPEAAECIESERARHPTAVLIVVMPP